MKTCIALCTRDRPQMLARCLGSLPAAIAEVSDPVCVVVVENSSTPKSRQTVLDFADVLDIHYVQEAEPGIPFARNRSVREALALEADWIIFIDDDEWVPADWLKTLHAARATYPQADVLTGPVLRHYPAGAPDWLPVSGQAGIPTGTRLTSAATNNTMVAARVFCESGHHLHFDERMRYTGGSDTEIFLRLKHQGGTLIWVEEARAHEEYAANRSTLTWHIERNIRRASGGVLIEALQGRSRLSYALPRMGWCLYVTLGRVAKGAVLFPFNRRQGHTHLMKAILSFASFWGLWGGVFRIQSQPYRILDGE